MKFSILYLIAFVFLVLILYGCSTGNSVREIKGDSSMDIKQVNVIASCDDDNQCTEDFFNQLTQQCEYKTLNHCCGDSVCDFDERCDTSTHKTVCPEDCPKQCPAYIEVSDWSCEGNCVKGPDHYLVDGDSIFTLNLENAGELSLNNVVSGFKCLKTNNNEFFTEKSLPQKKSGVLFQNYFETGQKSIYLNGEPYGRNKAEYHLEVLGRPTEDIELQCTSVLRASNYYSRHEIKIKLAKSS